MMAKKQLCPQCSKKVPIQMPMVASAKIGDRYLGYFLCGLCKGSLGVEL